MNPDRNARIAPWEALAAVAALLLAWHFLALRVRAAGLPGGDEGSWLSVAAELARGKGFTTRWLEAHFLVPYALPRPDDFRYPALTCLLAAVFRIFGASVEAGRWTVVAVYLAFTLLQIGLAAWVNSLAVLVMLLPALALMVLVVVPREERYLAARFPSEYLLYKREVRRWL